MAPDVFVSFAAADAAWVKGYLLDALHEAGLNAHTESDFTLGVPRLVELEHAIRDSRYVLIVLSPAYLADDFAEFTNVLGQTHGLETSAWPVIPLLLHPVNQVPLRLQMLTMLDATTAEAQSIAVERLCSLLQASPVKRTEKPPCPYPGMSAFSEDRREQYPFFGRDNAIQSLLLALRRHPFIAVIGPSGSGKSSFVSAGVIPVLRRSTLFESQDWLVITMRPGTKPLTTLLAQLPESYRDGMPMNTDSDEPARAKISGQQLLLFVDQFEETFTLGSSESIAFQERLLHFIHMPNCYVILAVRSDFLSELKSSDLWPEIRPNRMVLPPLDADGLRSAIVKPAESVNVFLEPTLVEVLVNDAEDEPGILPFVQEALVLMWDRLERRFLPQHAYDSLVQAYTDGKRRTGLQVAMALRADQAIVNLSSYQQVLAWRMFIRLVQFGEGRAETRRQQTVAQLRSADDNRTEFGKTLEALSKSRLLTMSGEEDEEGVEEKEGKEDKALKKDQEETQTVDLAHEALIQGWPQFHDWINAKRNAEQTRRRLEDKASEWVRLGRGSGALLDEVELPEADAWVNSKEASELGSSEDLVASIQKSRATIREATQTKRTMRRQRQVVVVSLSAIALMGLTVWGYREGVRLSVRTPVTEIAAGPATLGVASLTPDQGELPLRTETFTAFQMEQFEVTTAQYRACVGDVGPVHFGPCSKPRVMLERYEDERFADHPIVGMAGQQAAEYCAWMGRSLPTPLQWERAARGEEGRIWPWGNTEPITDQVQLLLVDADGLPRNTLTDTVEVSAMPQGATPDPQPIYHLADNVMEWVMVKPSATLPEFGIMGAAFDAPFVSLSALTPSPSENAGPSIGFRCVAN